MSQPLQKFREELPDQCPPAAATKYPAMTVVRAIEGPKAVSQDFDSHAKRKIARPDGVCLCRWASCSVFQAHETLKLPKIRNRKYLAFLVVDQESGLASAGHSGHFDYWFSSSFDPVAAVTKVVERN